MFKGRSAFGDSYLNPLTYFKEEYCCNYLTKSTKLN